MSQIFFAFSYGCKKFIDWIPDAAEQNFLIIISSYHHITILPHQHIMPEQPKMPEKRTRHFSKNLDKCPVESLICKGLRYKSRDDRLNSPKSGVWIFHVFLVGIFSEQQNFEQIKNREDSSDFDDSWTVLIATSTSTSVSVSTSTSTIAFESLVSYP